MAVHESDREDLMREAVALVRRIELQVPDEQDNVICGYRRNGSLAIYFGPDPVYQFDNEFRLRRGYVDGLLYRTQGTTLAALDRQRSTGVTQLVRHDLTPDELTEFLKSMTVRLQHFVNMLKSDTATIVAQVPPEAPILPQLIETLQYILDANGALAPQIKGKK